MNVTVPGFVPLIYSSPPFSGSEWVKDMVVMVKSPESTNEVLVAFCSTIVDGRVRQGTVIVLQGLGCPPTSS